MVALNSPLIDGTAFRIRWHAAVLDPYENFPNIARHATSQLALASIMIRELGTREHASRILDLILEKHTTQAGIQNPQSSIATDLNWLNRADSFTDAAKYHTLTHALSPLAISLYKATTSEGLVDFDLLTPVMESLIEKGVIPIKITQNLKGIIRQAKINIRNDWQASTTLTFYAPTMPETNFHSPPPVHCYPSPRILCFCNPQLLDRD